MVALVTLIVFILQLSFVVMAAENIKNLVVFGDSNSGM